MPGLDAGVRRECGGGALVWRVGSTSYIFLVTNKEERVCEQCRCEPTDRHFESIEYLHTY